MIKTLIIDDESPARQRIRRLLTAYQEIEVMQECHTGREAIEAIMTIEPDLIFLDIQMKDMSGFEVLEHIQLNKMPLTIFVTAYDKYALKAFDYFAFDYLLKPFRDDRFEKSLQKALNTLQSASPKEDNIKLNSLIRLLQEEKKESLTRHKTLPIKLAGRIYFIDIQDIQYIAASGYYIEIFTSNKKHLLRESLTNMMKKLEGEHFLRIHRSTIINTLFLEEINSLGLGDVEVLMKNGQAFKVSKRYKEDLFERLGIA